jgi:hypothetical protein
LKQSGLGRNFACPAQLFAEAVTLAGRSIDRFADICCPW